MRTFVALDIDECIRQRIERFVDSVRELAPEARWVRAESLHVTLKFIGEKPDESVEQIKRSLETIHAESFQLTFRGHGFFPTAKSARVFWLGIEADPQLVSLASKIDAAMEKLGIEKESRTYSAHLTLARSPGGSGSPGRQRSDKSNRVFARLQEKLPQVPVPEFGTMTAQEFYLYRSKLGRGGAQYTKIARFALQHD